MRVSSAFRRTVLTHRRGILLSVVVGIAIGACAPNRPPPPKTVSVPRAPVPTDYSCGPTTPQFSFANVDGRTCANAPNYGCLVSGELRAPAQCDPKPQIDELGLDIHCCFARVHAAYGPVTLWIRIDHEGVVENAGTEPRDPPADDAALEACLRNVVRSQRFPSCGSTTTFFKDFGYRGVCWG
jgi:hypothetical protein